MKNFTVAHEFMNPDAICHTRKVKFKIDDSYQDEDYILFCSMPGLRDKSKWYKLAPATLVYLGFVADLLNERGHLVDATCYEIICNSDTACKITDRLNETYNQTFDDYIRP